MGMKSYDLAIIGGGIVGMAVAMSIQRRFPTLRSVVLEKEPDIAQHQTGRNSGVIHSGIYYRPGSLKARACVRGRDRMVRFCEEQQVPYETCGKLIVATDAEEDRKLADLLERATANGVRGVRRISSEELREIEPHASGIAALHVPSTGIVDYAEVTRRYSFIFKSSGGDVRVSTRVSKIAKDHAAIVVETDQGSFSCNCVVNCAGLFSDVIAQSSGAFLDVKIIPFRGEYYRLKMGREDLVRNLIYPVPDPRLPFLGVHFTRRLSGEIEAGPNAVLAYKREGYRKFSFALRDSLDMMNFPGFWRMAGQWWRTGIDEFRRSVWKPAFVAALQKLVPEVRSNDLEYGGSGVRAQAVNKEGRLLDDFSIVEDDRMIHVCNVPSPAATASLEIGDTIAQVTERNLGQHLPKSIAVSI